MEKVLRKIRPIATIIGLGCLALYLTLSLVANIGFAIDGFGLSFISWFFELLLIGALGFAYFTKRKDMARIILIILLAYLAIALALGRDYMDSFFYGMSTLEKNPAVAYPPFTIVAAIFAFGALVLSLLGLFISKVFDKPLFGYISLGAIASYVLFTFIAYILILAGMIKANADYNGVATVAEWYYFLDATGELIFLPCAALFGFICYQDKE